MRIAIIGFVTPPLTRRVLRVAQGGGAPPREQRLLPEIVRGETPAYFSPQ